MSAIAAEHSAAFETTWRVAGSEYATFGRKSLRVIGSEIQIQEEIDDENRKVSIKTAQLSTLNDHRRYLAGTVVSYQGTKFRITESQTEGRSCYLYTIESP